MGRGRSRDQAGRGLRELSLDFHNDVEDMSARTRRSQSTFPVFRRCSPTTCCALRSDDTDARREARRCFGRSDVDPTEARKHVRTPDKSSRQVQSCGEFSNTVRLTLCPKPRS
jgi:hypothetical protein